MYEYDYFGGPLVNRLMVAPDVRRIFAYRKTMLREIFGDGRRAAA